MTRSNAIIDALKVSPCSVEDLPYKPVLAQFGIKNRRMIRKIHVNGRKSKMNGGPFGRLKTVYFLEDDFEAAVSKFVTVNLEVLKLVDFSSNNHIADGLPRGWGSKIRKEFQKRR